ncbi:MAG: hypothetical protein PHC61_09650, partial [Chitinivibrionales bacterium]|nr:hypothetical protein [Chitinivibrionales bacterium]
CDVLGFLDKVDSLGAAGALSPAEVSDAHDLRRRLSSEYGLFSWKSKSQDARVNVRLALVDTSGASAGKKSALFMRGTVSPSLYANINNISFFGNLDVWTDYRSDTIYHPSTYEPYDGIPYNLYGRADSSHVRSSDLPRGGVNYIKGPVRFEASIDRLKDGPAIESPLTFSGFAPPEIYFRGQVAFGLMTYMQAFGLLQSQVDKSKYFYLHRIDVPLFSSRLDIGLTEVVVTGSTTDEADTRPDSANALRPSYYGQTRDWVFPYMVPFVPYLAVEHLIGGLRDNKNISLDFNLAYPDNFRWYFEWFIDDMTSPWTMFSNDWGNKLAGTFGCQYFGRAFDRDVTASAEYSRVEPWVYTHFYGGSHRYDNFNVPLGAPLGPDSDLLSLLLEYRLFHKSALGLSFTNARTDPAARGGSIRNVFQDPGSAHPDSPTKVFLGPGAQTQTRLGAFWKWDRFGRFQVNAKYDYDFSGMSIFQLYGGLYF